MIEIYFDGSCQDNPHGAIAYGYHINLNGTEIHSGFGGEPACKGNSNNVAEYKALLLALEECRDIKGKTILIKGDSKLVIMQMTGRWRIKDGMYRKDALLAREVVQRLASENLVEFKWIPREENVRADELSNEYYYQ